MDEHATTVVSQYNDTIHSSRKMKPKEAHDDKNHMSVRVNLTKGKRTLANIQSYKKKNKTRSNYLPREG